MYDVGISNVGWRVVFGGVLYGLEVGNGKEVGVVYQNGY